MGHLPTQRDRANGKRCTYFSNTEMADTVPAMDKQEEEMSESSNSSKKPPFFKGQRVFAKDETSGILYEAVVRRTMFGMTRQRQIHQHEDENEIEEFINTRTRMKLKKKRKNGIVLFII